VTFTTPAFLLYFVVFLSVYAWTPPRSRKGVLLFASYVFYGAWSLWFLLLLIGTTLFDWQVGRLLGRTDDAGRRKRLIAASVVANLSVLGFFKYVNFFVDSASGLLALAGVQTDPQVLQIVLPIGISFYTFQSMSYTIDVYRRDLPPARTLVDFALYVTFFPQLVAGPIERATHLIPQCERVGTEADPVRATGLTNRWDAWGLIALGAFKKVVIADNLAPLVELTYADPENTLGPAMWLGTYAFAAQIYCDFSGYSDIAVGIGRLLGFDLMQNFRAPYAADGPSDFWRRWHISLSSWLRDYLYIPLGGNRSGEARARLNLVLTMLLGGLWHGAAWNYVLWGAYHGLLLVVFRPAFLRAFAERLPAQGAVRVLRRLAFFHLTCLGWALFRAESLSDCGAIFARLLFLEGWSGGAFFDAVRASGEGPKLALLTALIVGLVVVHNLRREDPSSAVRVVAHWPLAVRVLCVLLMLAACVAFAPEKPPPFIYFQF
jgi:D-alanyl-lipoteichoic acid acyltransferase DltB (MBOAT superfamily)